MTQKLRFSVIFGKKDKVRYAELEKEFGKIDQDLRPQAAKELMLEGMKHSNILDQYKKMSQNFNDQTNPNEIEDNSDNKSEKKEKISNYKKKHEFNKTGNLF